MRVTESRDGEPLEKVAEESDDWDTLSAKFSNGASGTFLGIAS